MELGVFSPRTSPELPPEALGRARLSFAAWGKGLTQELYLERERTLWRTPFSQGLRLWVLSHQGRALASCETYEVEAILAGRDPGGDRAGTGHGVASVFVEDALRGRGHAAPLLVKVHERLRQEGALLAYLMSEIGPTLYEKVGYAPRPLRARVFSAATGDEQARGDHEHQPLHAEDLGELLGRRYQRPLRSPVTVRVSAAQVLWHVERGRFYAGALGLPAPASIGVRAGAAFGLWAHDPLRSVLRVLMLYPGPAIHAAGTIADPRAPEAVHLREVIHVAREEAARGGLRTVEIWENAQNAGWLRGGVPADARDLPMLLGLGPGVRAGDWLDWERCHWL